MTVMAKPVLVLVDDEDASRQELTREPESRYGAHYRIVAGPSPEAALARLREFRAEAVAVPLVLADQWMPGMTGAEFLAQVKDILPTARRGLLFSWFDRAAAGPIKHWNTHPRPFTWTKTADEILGSLAKYLARISGVGYYLAVP